MPSGGERTHFEAPGLILILLGGVANAYPLIREDLTAETVILYPKWAVQNAAFVQSACDAQSLCEFSRAGASTQARIRTAWGSSISPVTMLSIQCIP